MDGTKRREENSDQTSAACITHSFERKGFLTLPGKLLGYTQAGPEDIFHFLQKHINETYRYVSKLIDIFCAVGTVEQAEQPNYVAEGQTPL
eukprot:1154412-Pelagomonas_calceolata.AAC.3